LSVTSAFPAAQAPATALHKVSVMVVAKKPDVMRDLEFAMRQALAGREVETASYSAMFPASASATPAQIQEKLKTQGFDALLVLRRRDHVRILPKEIFSSLDNFLKAGTSSPMLETEFIVDPGREPERIDTHRGMQNSQPIPGSTARAGYEMYKVMVILFDVQT